MGIKTLFLNLFKTDMATDGDDYFDFDRDLNDNWDKIDEYAQNATNERATFRDIHNRLYDGVNLAEKFADEIAQFETTASWNFKPWLWIQDRITNGNYEGLHVGDYIPFTLPGGNTANGTVAQQNFQMQIAGIDTYTNCGDVEIGHHIDFISREVIDNEVTWQPTDNNNGTSINPNPWQSSKAKAWLNGINNYNTANAYNKVAHGFNANNNGVLQLIPTELRNIIVEKRMLLDERYSSSGLITTGTTWNWGDMGKLWLPNEIEVYGTQIRGNVGQTNGWWNPEANVAVAYPLFLGAGRNRVKRTSTGGRSLWWLSSVDSYNTATVCDVSGGGSAGSSYATSTGIRCPLCFRLAQS